MTNLIVFRASNWTETGPGLWEAAPPPNAAGERPAFEATCWICDDANGQQPCWRWTLYRPPINEPNGDLEPLAQGSAPTLAEAQRQADRHAQEWRDNPHRVGAERWEELSNLALVACDGCGAVHRIGELLAGDGRCGAKSIEGDGCDGASFDGHPVETYAEAVTGR